MNKIRSKGKKHSFHSHIIKYSFILLYIVITYSFYQMLFDINHFVNNKLVQAAGSFVLT